MASVSLRSKTNLLTSIPKRYASSAAAAKSNEHKHASLPKESIKVSKLENGIVVASLENHSPITRIAAVVSAGARDEAYNELGASHALRVYSSLATRNYSLFGVSRNLDQIGADFSVSSSRENTTYLLQATRSNISKGADILGEVISRPELRHWEIHDAHPRFEFELNVYDEQPEAQIIEMIHRASFKNALSNSLYAPRFNLSNLNGDVLQEFRKKNFTSNRLTLIGFGINHDDLIKNASFFRLPGSGNSTRQQAKYFGSELRHETDSEIVHAALGFEGVSKSNKDALASGIVKHAFGGFANRVKYSNGSSKLAKAIQPLSSEPSAAVAFNANYSDTGLFGFHLVGNKNDIGKIVKGVHKELVNASKNGLSNDEITRAKNSFKACFSYYVENPQNLIEKIALNVDNAQQYTNLEELYKKIDQVSANDINAFVKKLASSKPSLASVGDLSQMIRIDELSS